MTLAAGTKLGSYEILSPVGAGGMGEVYRARDMKLRREVAIKVLPESVAGDQGALARFEREAFAVAALSHPNILAIHDYGDEGGVAYAVMELLEGETLRARLGAGPMPQEVALEYALQVTRGLAAAHEKGLVHRDLKPENLFVTNDGFVKILDFGLAKQTVEVATEEELSAATASVLPAAYGARTEPGVVLGTLGYMSPEQVRGEPVDRRSDIFSFGTVLYEMLTGTKAFRRDTAAETMAAIMRDEPALAAEGAAIPSALASLVRRCLEKRPEDRFQTAREVMAELAEVVAGAASSAGEPARSRRTTTLMLGSAVLVLVAVAVVVTLVARRGAPPPPSGAHKRIAVIPFENLGPAAEEYFADGVTDEIRGKLTSLPSLAVIARDSSTRYKETKKTLRQIAEELGVTYILTGTVRWEKATGGGQVQVTPELVEVPGKGAPESRWQQRFRAGLTDVFEVQANIATQVASQLGVVLGGAAKEKLAEQPTSNLDAYDEYLRGEEVSAALSKSDLPSVKLAISHYEKAVALDPSFARAWAALGYERSVLYYNGTPTPALATGAQEAAARAVALAPGLAAGYVATAGYQMSVLHEPRRALDSLDRALQLEPSSVPALATSVYADIYLGRFEEAVGRARQAIGLDPLAIPPRQRLGMALLLLRRLPEAREVLDRARSLAPTHLYPLELRTMVSLAEGDLAGARAVIRSVPKEVDQKALVAFFATYWDLGWALDNDQRALLLRLSPSDFEDKPTWALYLALEYWQEGNAARARELAAEAADGYKAQVAAAPQDGQRHCLLAWALALAGRKSEAVREGLRGVELLPATRDALSGAYSQHLLARIYVLTGEYDKAIDTLAPLLQRPYFLTKAWLRIDPAFAPLRDNPRFKKLVAGT